VSRYARRQDANHGAIRDGLRALGVWVWDTHDVGGGFPDLIACRRDRKVFHLLEVKDGAKPPSARKLTPDEAAFIDGCPGVVHVVLSLDEAIEALGLAVKTTRGAA
jgi:hypothetical protein